MAALAPGRQQVARDFDYRLCWYNIYLLLLHVAREDGVEVPRLVVRIIYADPGFNGEWRGFGAEWLGRVLCRASGRWW